MELNILHLKPTNFQYGSKGWHEAVIRAKRFKDECAVQGIEDITVWDGIYDAENVCRAISQSHKAIVRAAKEEGLKMAAIAEDDIMFYAPGAWKYYLDNMPESFDLYLGTSYHAMDYPNGLIRDQFDSLILYTIHERFYDEFLAMPEVNHIDRELSKLANKKEFRIVNPYVCGQHIGYSFNVNRVVDYTERMKEKAKFGQ